MMGKQHTTGFTLIELAIVITIMAILIAILLPVFASVARSNNQQTCMNNLHNIGVLLGQYRQDHGVYPAAPLPVYLRTEDPTALPYSSVPYQVAEETETDATGHTTLVPYVFTGKGSNSVMQVIGDQPNTKTPMNFLVEIDTTGPPATFRWSLDGGKSWREKDVPITGSDQTLSNGIAVKFQSPLGHATADAWNIYVKPLQPDLPDGDTLQPLALTAAANAGDTQITLADTTGLVVGMHALLHDYDPASANTDTVKIVAINGNVLTVSPSLKHDYLEDPDHAGNFGVLDPRVGNFGLATLYYQYIDDGKNSEKQTTSETANPERAYSPDLFHCPQLISTAEVNRDANVDAVTDDGMYRTIDPLWAGFNTYDVMYNYDQFDQAIHDFDAAMGFGNVDSVRQLKNPDAPTDTVVCWCYGHTPSQTPAFPSSWDPSAPDAVGEQAMLAAEHGHRNEHALILWLDGSVGAMTPTMMRRKDDVSGEPAYYWQPQFLYSQGETSK